MRSAVAAGPADDAESSDSNGAGLLRALPIQEQQFLQADQARQADLVDPGQQEQQEAEEEEDLWSH